MDRNKLILVLFLSFSISASAQVKPRLFYLSDTAFTIGQTYTDYNILFETGSYKIYEPCLPHLDSIVLFLKKNPGLKIEIGYHTDCRDKAYRGSSLSLQRAQAIKEYLIGKSTSDSSLTTKGYGSTMPIIMSEDLVIPETGARKEKVLKKGTLLSCEYIQALSVAEHREYAHHLNRRIVFKITGL